MSDKLDMTPELTLDPSAAAQAPAPELTLDAGQTQSQADQAALQAQRDANAVKLDESMLSEAERKLVDEFSPEDRRHRLQPGAPVRGGGPEEHRRLLRERPEQRQDQGPGGGGRGPVLPGGGAEALWRGRGEEGGHLRLLPEEKERAGGPEGQLRQGGDQRGQDRQGAGEPPGHPDEGQSPCSTRCTS